LVNKKVKAYLNHQQQQLSKMLGSMVNCVKALFGLDSSDYDDKNFEMCEPNCLCSESTVEPICTSPNIVQEYCPSDRYQIEPSVATTTLPSVVSPTPRFDVRSIEPTPIYEGSGFDSTLVVIQNFTELSKLFFKKTKSAVV
jgi:hypothetical protein